MPSGIVSVVFSAATVFNIAHAFLIYRRTPTKRMVVGALLGLVGIVCLFWEVLTGAALDSNTVKGLGLALLGTWFFALGSMVAARNNAHGLPLLSVNAWGMLYATIIMLFVALLRGVAFTFDPSPVYVWALLYLAIPASVIGYTTYLHVVNRLGPERAAYITVLFPAVALTVSVIFEGYRVTLPAVLGLMAIMVGNVLVLAKTRKSISTDLSR